MDECLVGGSIPSGCTFMPDGATESFDGLLDLVRRQRFTTFVTVSAEIDAVAPRMSSTSGFFDSALGVIGAPATYRRALVNDTAFLVWLGMAMQAANAVLAGKATTRHGLRHTLHEFVPMRRRFDERMASAAALAIPGTSVLVQRFDIDPLIARATPPSYTFSPLKERQRRLTENGHSVAFFRDVVRIALERIRGTWPECHRLVDRLVRVIGYLPDATFRSCSASRYTGTIYLTAKDNSLLDLEESLIHEAGHQLLYTIVEVFPVAWDEDGQARQYTLPWSGQRRDFYGYFHAFFIYTLLAKYFERVAGAGDGGHTAAERRRARERMTTILRGLTAATADFAGNESFTSNGEGLFQSLQVDIDRLAAEHLGQGTSRAS